MSQTNTPRSSSHMPQRTQCHKFFPDLFKKRLFYQIGQKLWGKVRQKKKLLSPVLVFLGSQAIFRKFKRPRESNEALKEWWNEFVWRQKWRKCRWRRSSICNFRIRCICKGHCNLFHLLWSWQWLKFLFQWWGLRLKCPKFSMRLWFSFYSLRFH